MKEPLLSILIPVYGVERWIERCAVSLFEQDYENIEYIFVDDCTKDHSIDILRDVMSRYPNRATQVKILRHERNRGLAAARTTAFNAASGEYIRIVDSDDSIPEDSCRRMVDAILSSGADVVIGGYRTLLPENRDTVSLPVPVNERTLKKRLCRISPPAMWSCIFNRDYLISHNLRWQEGINISEDYMMMSRILLKARTSLIEDIVYQYDFTQGRNYNALYGGLIQQLSGSLFAVWNYYASSEYFPTYRRALELALLDPLREEHRSRRAGYEFESCYPSVKPYLNGVAKFTAFLLHRERLYLLGDLVYRMWRVVVLAF